MWQSSFSKYKFSKVPNFKFQNPTFLNFPPPRARLQEESNSGEIFSRWIIDNGFYKN
jgi:hypothetical protein